MPSSSALSPKTPGPAADLRVAIVGAGLVGLGIAWRLAAAGARVTVCERGELGRGASWAAAGMLAAGAEAEPGEDALTRLTLESRAAWPAFAAELEAASGLPVDLRREGTLLVALGRDDAEALRRQQRFAAARGIALDWLSGRAVRRLEPALTPRVTGALSSPEDMQVDNRRVVAALAAAARAAGAEIREHTPVTALETAAGRVSGLRLGETRLPADRVVLAAGAWSPALEGLPPALRPPVRPLKGQMLAVQMDPAKPLLRHVVWTPTSYLVPRRDGRLIVGATVEEAGFDDQVTAGGLLSLLDGAWRALPGVEDLPVAEVWTGLRPTARDDAPILGETALPGLILATGHHRNGVLLLPVTADGIAELILTGRCDPAIAPWSLARFGDGAGTGAGAAGAAAATEEVT